MKKLIMGFILGIVLCSGIVHGANIYKSETIQYSPSDASWEVNNVDDALNSLNDTLNSLYDKTNNNISSAAYVSDIMTQLYAETATKELQITLPAGTYWIQASINNYRNLDVNKLWSKIETSWNSTQIYTNDTYYHKVNGGIVTITQETTLIATYSAGGLNALNHEESYTCILNAIKLS